MKESRKIGLAGRVVLGVGATVTLVSGCSDYGNMVARELALLGVQQAVVSGVRNEIEGPRGTGGNINNWGNQQSVPPGTFRRPDGRIQLLPDHWWADENNKIAGGGRMIPENVVQVNAGDNEVRHYPAEDYIWVQNGNMWAGVKKLPDNITMEYAEDGKTMYRPADGYVWVQEGDPRGGVREIERKVMLYKYKDFNQNGVLEQHELFELKGAHKEINVKGFELACLLMTPDKKSPVTYSIIFSDGSKKAILTVPADQIYLIKRNSGEESDFTMARGKDFQIRVAAEQDDIAVFEDVKIINP